jgi:hypothetical protein
MGFRKLVEGAPKKDPQFILPLDPPEQPISDAELLRRDRSVNRTIRIACGVGAAVLVGGMCALTIAEHRTEGPQAAQDVSNAPSKSISALASEQSSKSATPSMSSSSTTEMPTPTVTRTQVLAASSPTHIPSSSVTTLHSATPSSTRNTRPPSSGHTKPTASCDPNPNAPGEIVCTSPVWTYTSPTGAEHAFQITGGAAPDCSRQEAGRVLVAISNDEAWANTAEIGNPC